MSMSKLHTEALRLLHDGQSFGERELLKTTTEGPSKKKTYFSHGQSVSSNNGGGMDFLTHKAVCPLQKLGSKDDNRGGAISNLLVLHVC